MSWLDLIIVAAVLYGCIRGLMKGLVREVASVVGVFIAIFIARIYYIGFAEPVKAWFDLDIRYAQPVAFVVIFLAVVLACHFIAILIDKFLKIITLSWLNRILGAVFGVLKMLLIVGILLNVMAAFGEKTGVFPQKAVENSIFYSSVKNVAALLLP